MKKKQKASSRKQNKKTPVLLQPPAAAAQEAAEGFSEGDVAQGITARVDSAVHVAQPVSCGPQGVRDAAMAEGSNNGHNIVRRPGEDEYQDDGQDGPRDPPLPRHHSLPPPLM